MKIVNIKTEYLVNPIGIDIVSPRINWNLEDIDKQESFTILYEVNGNKKTTGIISSELMYYDFKEKFNSRDIVKFKIVVNSKKGMIESDINSFEIGLLNKEDFKAKWISGNYKPNKKERYPVDYFKKPFDIKNIVKARLYITAFGLYEAYINNKRVGNFVLAPGSTDYRKRVQYQTYDVLDLLKEGKNEIKVTLADGWYRGSIGAKGMNYIFGKDTALFIQLELTDKNGDISYVLSDSSFNWSNDGSIRFADLKDGEIIDANLIPSYKDFAKEIKVEANITASNNTFVEEHEVFEPIKSFKTLSGKTIYEFKQNLAGYISFKVNAKKGEKIHLRMGEMLDEKGELTLKNIQCIHKGKKTPLQEVHYTCFEGLNEYKGKFFIAGFKYVEVDSNVELEEIKQIALYSSLEETSTFNCSNELVNIFYRNTLWSLKSNSADVPTDCPTRERMGWTGDSQVFFNTASYLTNYAAFSRKHLVDVFDRQDANGRLPQIAPYNAEDWYMDVMNGSVGWADVGVLMPYRYYKKYGDKRLLEKYYDQMMNYARFMMERCGRAKGIYAIYAKPTHLTGINKKYVVNNGQSYGEWAEPNDVKAFVWTDFCEPHPEESTAYTTYIMRLMIEISKLLGKEENIELLKKYEDGTRLAYQELVTKERHSLDTDRQAKLVRPLYMNLLTDTQIEFAKKRLVKALENYDYRLGTGFLSTPFILDVLSKIDVELAYKLLENEKMPGWLYMAKNDTGTIWESWEGPTAQKGIASLNHYSKGAVVEWLIRGMCGINIESDNRFRIEPLVGGKETYAKASYNSIYGLVSSSWTKDKDGLKFEIEIPSNCTATFVYNDEIVELKAGKYSFRK